MICCPLSIPNSVDRLSPIKALELNEARPDELIAQ